MADHTGCIIFLLVNTAYYWEWRLGAFAMEVFVFLVLSFLILAVFLVKEIYLFIKEKFSVKKRLFTIGVLTAALSLTSFFPGGLINFASPEDENLLVAQAEGAANCMTTLILKDNNRFIERTVCFGFMERRGNYIIKNDTIFFERVSMGRNEEYYQFAVVKKRESVNGKYEEDIVRFKNYADKTGHVLRINKNNLAK